MRSRLINSTGMWLLLAVIAVCFSYGLWWLLAR